MSGMWEDIKKGSQVPKEAMPKETNAEQEQANLRRHIEAAKPPAKPAPAPPPRPAAEPAPQPAKNKPEITKIMQKIDLYKRNDMLFQADEVSIIVRDLIKALGAMTVFEFAIFSLRINGGPK